MRVDLHVTQDDGTVIAVPGDSLGNLQINQQSFLDETNDKITAFTSGYSNFYSSAATNASVKTGAGQLHALTLTETAAGTITLYDGTSTSGTVIAVLKASIAEGTYFFDVAFGTGLYVAPAAASKFSISFK